MGKFLTEMYNTEYCTEKEDLNTIIENWDSSDFDKRKWLLDYLGESVFENVESTYKQLNPKLRVKLTNLIVDLKENHKVTLSEEFEEEEIDVDSDIVDDGVIDDEFIEDEYIEDEMIDDGIEEFDNIGDEEYIEGDIDIDVDAEIQSYNDEYDAGFEDEGLIDDNPENLSNDFYADDEENFDDGVDDESYTMDDEIDLEYEDVDYEDEEEDFEDDEYIGG